MRRKFDGRKMCKVMKRIVVLMLFMSLFSGVSAEMISSTDFESLDCVPVTRDLWESEGFRTGSWDNGLASRTMVDDSAVSVSGTKSLRVLYPKGTYGTSDNGAQVELKFEPRREAFASYWLRFSEDFSFGSASEGGKLPGLTGGDNCSGGSACDGTNGFSARLMWRTGGSLVLYLYHMDKPDTYGEDHELALPDGSAVVAEKGEWIHVAERVKINTDGETYDGEVEIWVNGVRALFLDSLRFTSNGDMVDKLYISTFHGGASAEWAPANDCHIWFDDIRVGTEYEDVAFSDCPKPNLGGDRALCAERVVVLEAEADGTDVVRRSWTKDGVLVGHDVSLTLSEPGSYVLTVDSAWCSKKDTVVVSEAILTDLGDDKVVCSSSFLKLSSNVQGDAMSYAWEKDGTPIGGAEDSLLVKDAGSYKLTVVAEGCVPSADEVTVSSGLLSVADVKGGAGETFDLTVTDGGSNYGWYNEEGELLHVGAEYRDVFEEGRRLFFVKDLDAFSGSVGMKKLTVAKSYTSAALDRKMRFEVFRKLTIDSVSVYLVEEQDVVIRVLNADETVLFRTESKGLKAGENRIAVNAELLPGSYFMDAYGSTGRLRHSNELDAVEFPYEIEGLISLLGSNLSWIDNKPWYLFFYDWKISAGNNCAAAPVYAEGRASSSAQRAVAGRLTVFPNLTDDFTKVCGLDGTERIEVFDELGKGVRCKIERGAGCAVVHLEEAGVYCLKVSDKDMSYAFKVIRR